MILEEVDEMGKCIRLHGKNRLGSATDAQVVESNVAPTRERRVELFGRFESFTYSKGGNVAVRIISEPRHSSNYMYHSPSPMTQL